MDARQKLVHSNARNLHVNADHGGPGLGNTANASGLENRKRSLVPLSATSKQIACWLVKQSENGIAEATTASGDTLRAAFLDLSVRELCKALAEPEAEGYVSSAGGIGREIPRPFATADLSATFDPVAVGTAPHADACVLIEHIIAEGKAGESSNYSLGSPELQEVIGWPLRRFNPALSVVIDLIDQSRVSRALGGEFAARSFIVTASEEIEFERYLARVAGQV